MSFSKISADGESRAATEMEKPLPSIKVFNRQSVNEMLASLEEIEINRELIEKAGPTPGVFSIAATLQKMRLSPRNSISFKRVGIK